mmetsp:Transcript_13082/g.28256  ORF Transcript_13082/g.28256 Transcript_13082/m.28256 type:complete len:267 (+) Transcript_13082:3056-3856(+)
MEGEMATPSSCSRCASNTSSAAAAAAPSSSDDDAAPPAMHRIRSRHSTGEWGASPPLSSPSLSNGPPSRRYVVSHHPAAWYAIDRTSDPRGFQQPGENSRSGGRAGQGAKLLPPPPPLGPSPTPDNSERLPAASDAAAGIPPGGGRIPPAATYAAAPAAPTAAGQPSPTRVGDRLEGGGRPPTIPGVPVRPSSSTIPMAPGPVHAKKVSTTALLYSTGRDRTSTSRMELAPLLDRGSADVAPSEPEELPGSFPSRSWKPEREAAGV